MANIIKLDTASKRYAYALYSLAEKNNNIEEIQSEFSKIVDVFKSLPKWISFTEDPAIEHSKRAESFIKGISNFHAIKELEDFFKVLTPKQKTIMKLKFVYGFKESEIADKLNISRQAVYKTKIKSLSLIRSNLLFI